MEPLGRARCSCRTHHSPRAVRRPSGAPAPALTLSYLPGSFPPELVSSCGASLSAGTRLVLLQEQAFIRTPRKGSPVPCHQPANQITATGPCSRSPQPACHARSQQPRPPPLVWGSWGTTTGSPLHPGCITFGLLSICGRNDLTRDCSNGIRKLRRPLTSAPHLVQ